MEIIDGPGGHGNIYDVRLVVAYADPGAGYVCMSLSPTTTDGLGGFSDPSTPDAPVFIRTVKDGSAPYVADAYDLPRHGIYGEGTHWQEFGLGNFDTPDSPIGDFYEGFPNPTTDSNLAQINVYKIDITGTKSVHFDLYSTLRDGDKIKYVKAPFSHDGSWSEGGGGGDQPVPEPTTIALFCLGVAGLEVVRRLRRF